MLCTAGVMRDVGTQLCGQYGAVYLGIGDLDALDTLAHSRLHDS